MRFLTTKIKACGRFSGEVRCKYVDFFFFVAFKTDFTENDGADPSEP